MCVCVCVCVSETTRYLTCHTRKAKTLRTCHSLIRLVVRKTESQELSTHKKRVCDVPQSLLPHDKIKNNRASDTSIVCTFSSIRSATVSVCVLVVSAQTKRIKSCYNIVFYLLLTRDSLTWKKSRNLRTRRLCHLLKDPSKYPKCNSTFSCINSTDIEGCSPPSS